MDACKEPALPPKKRKRNQQKSVSEEAFADPDDCEEEEESRELTHEEIWDDSALVSDWEAATEEYEWINKSLEDRNS